MIISMKILSTKSDSKTTTGNLARRKMMSILLKHLIFVARKRNQPVDIIPVFLDIFSQSFQVHQSRFFHKSCKPF